MPSAAPETPYRKSARAPELPVFVQLAVPLEFKWPKRCVKCGTERELGRDAYVLEREPPWLPATIFLGFLPFLILRALLRKTATVSLLLCPACRERLRDGRTAESVFTVLCLVFGAAILALLGNEAWVLGSLVMLSTAIGLIAMRRRYILGRTVRLVAIRSGELVLAGVHADVAHAVVERLSARSEAPVREARAGGARSRSRRIR